MRGFWVSAAYLLGWTLSVNGLRPAVGRLSAGRWGRLFAADADGIVGESSKASELTSMLESMPTSEKYSLLIQSYANKILSDPNRNATLLSTMESLYIEMIAGGSRPTDKSSELLITASSSFCNSAKLGRALQLTRASGAVKAFGVANGLLTTPILSASVASQLFASKGSKMMSDDRETEVVAAASVGVSVALFFVLQVVGWVDSDVHPYATLCGCALVLAAAADVLLSEGGVLKKAASGLERLSLRDKQRDAHTEASAFLVGYLLGLPCFCFQPDVTEALKLLRSSPGALDVYKQPVALAVTKKAVGTGGGGGGGGNSPASFFSLSFPASSAIKLTPASSKKVPSSAGQSQTSQNQQQQQQQQQQQVAATPPSNDSKEAANSRLLRSFLDVDANAKADLQGLARLLVWLVAPVAAETIKYGSSVVSDPRRGRKTLEALESLQQVARKRASGSGASGDVGLGGSDLLTGGSSEGYSPTGLEELQLPSSTEDREALVQWAYNEASLLVRRYGELLEALSDYVQSGTASIGECALLIEQELR